MNSLYILLGLVVATSLITPSITTFAQPYGQMWPSNNPITADTQPTYSGPPGGTTQQQPLTNATNNTMTNTTTSTTNTTAKIPIYNGTKGYDTPPKEPLFSPGANSSNSTTTTPQQQTQSVPQIFPQQGPIGRGPGGLMTPPPASTSTGPNFAQIVNDCSATVQRMYPGAQTSADVLLKAPQSTSIASKAADFKQMKQCNILLGQALAQSCNNLLTYDATMCNYMQTPQISNLIDMTAVIAQQSFAYEMDVPPSMKGP